MPVLYVFRKMVHIIKRRKKLAGRKTLIICHVDTHFGQCPGSDLKKPAYMIEWSRFGSMNKYRWSGSAWTKQ